MATRGVKTLISAGLIYLLLGWASAELATSDQHLLADPLLEARLKNVSWARSCDTAALGTSLNTSLGRCDLTDCTLVLGATYDGDIQVQLGANHQSINVDVYAIGKRSRTLQTFYRNATGSFRPGLSAGFNYSVSFPCADYQYYGGIYRIQVVVRDTADFNVVEICQEYPVYLTTEGSSCTPVETTTKGAGSSNAVSFVLMLSAMLYVYVQTTI